MTEQCSHTVCRSAEDGKTFCQSCGEQVMQVHDRPCGECRHFKRVSYDYAICKPKMMRVTDTMHVSYYVHPSQPHHYGLCFEDAPQAEAGEG